MDSVFPVPLSMHIVEKRFKVNEKTDLVSKKQIFYGEK